MQLRQFVGIPYDSKNCYELVRDAGRELFDLDLPDVQVPASPRKQALMLADHAAADARFERVDEPQAGDIVILGRAGTGTHVGLMVEADGKLMCLHTLKFLGSIIADVEALGAHEIISYHRAL